MILKKNWKKIRDNEESIQMELETSENLEKELNEKIDMMQQTLEADKVKEK